MKLGKLFLTALLCATLAVACVNEGGVDNGGGGGKEPLYEKENCNVMGTVTCNGVGVAGVAVSDGASVTKTDNSGRYWLEDVAVEREPEIFISIPSGYETIDLKGMGQAFYHRAKNEEGVQTFNFTLKEVDQSNYELLVMADSHVLGGASKYGSTEDVKKYKEQFLPRFNEYIQQCKGEGRRVYGLHCGDMTQKSAWKKYTLKNYRDDTTVADCPIFNTIGNHDHDTNTEVGVTGNYDDNTQYLSRKTFRETIGPAYYSFNLGTEHYIVLDDIYILQHETSYETKVDPRQLSWLTQDVAAIDRSKIKGIVLSMHAPMFNRNGVISLGSGDKVLEKLRDFPVTIMIGHNHMDRTIFSETSKGKPVVEFLHPTLASVAWLGDITTDGVPGSFVAYNFKDGRSSKRLFVPIVPGYTVDKPYRIYDNRSNKWNYPIVSNTGHNNTHDADLAGADANTTPAVIINAWGAVRCVPRVAGVAVDNTSTLATNGIYDPAYRDWFWVSIESSDRNSISYVDKNKTLPDWQSPPRTNFHIWRFVPSNPATPIMVDLYDAHDKCTTVTLYAQ